MDHKTQLKSQFKLFLLNRQILDLCGHIVRYGWPHIINTQKLKFNIYIICNKSGTCAIYFN